jgi:hypothetical protein
VKIDIEWLPEFPLERTKLRHTVSYSLAAQHDDRLPDGPGIYVFAREGRSRVEALYVGKAEVLKRRVRNQLNNLTLMNHVAESGMGRKIVVCGKFMRTISCILPNGSTSQSERLSATFLRMVTI